MQICCLKVSWGGGAVRSRLPFISATSESESENVKCRWMLPARVKDFPWNKRRGSTCRSGPRPHPTLPAAPSYRFVGLASIFVLLTTRKPGWCYLKTSFLTVFYRNGSTFSSKSVSAISMWRAAIGLSSSRNGIWGGGGGACACACAAAAFRKRSEIMHPSMIYYNNPVQA